MRASVIVITRNHVEYITAALQQISLSDYPDFEIVVVDSSDGEAREKTAKACAQFNAKYILEPRLGQSLARNTGRTAATGDVLVFTDDDCLPEKNWLARVMANYSDPGVWGCSG